MMSGKRKQDGGSRGTEGNVRRREVEEENKEQLEQTVIGMSPTQGQRQQTLDTIPEKQKGQLRIISQNINNLGVDSKSMKSNEVGRIICEDDADIWLVQEVGINWSKTVSSEQWDERIRGKWRGSAKAVFAHNTSESQQQRHQPGGVGTILKGGLIGRKKQSGKDTRGLGRWSWIEIQGRQGKKTIIISAYRPVRQECFGTNTVFEQHARTLAKASIHENPREQFLRDLAEQVDKWHEHDYTVILGMDANQNV